MMERPEIDLIAQSAHRHYMRINRGYKFPHTAISSVRRFHHVGARALGLKGRSLAAPERARLVGLMRKWGWLPIKQKSGGQLQWKAPHLKVRRKKRPRIRRTSSIESVYTNTNGENNRRTNRRTERKASSN